MAVVVGLAFTMPVAALNTSEHIANWATRRCKSRFDGVYEKECTKRERCNSVCERLCNQMYPIYMDVHLCIRDKCGGEIKEWTKSHDALLADYTNGKNWGPAFDRYESLGRKRSKCMLRNCKMAGRATKKLWRAKASARHKSRRKKTFAHTMKMLQAAAKRKTKKGKRYARRQ